MDFNGQLQALMNAMKSTNLLQKSAPLAYVRSLVQVFTANLNTICRAESAFTGPVLLFQTQDIDDDPDDDEIITAEEAVERWKSTHQTLKSLRPTETI